jgi:hypothetical protein
MHRGCEVTCCCWPEKKSRENETPQTIQEKQKLNQVGCLTTREEKTAVREMSANPRMPVI